jgi:hypothetical protein
MNTEHYIIRETRAAHENREAATQSWNNLVREFRSARWVAASWLGILALVALIGVLFVSTRPELRLLFLPPVAFLALTSPILFLAQKRREAALFSIIAREAPMLSQKLQADGIGLGAGTGQQGV